MLKENYFKTTQVLLERVYLHNQSTIETLGPLMAKSVAEGGVIHTFGSGHSEIIGREMVGRAGGLVCVSAILDMTGGFIENLEGYGTQLAARYDRNHGLKAGEFLIAISNSGKNCSPIEVARYAHEKGLKVIALTSVGMAQQVKTTHSEGKKLHEIADFVLDNCGSMGDAIVELPEKGKFAGPTSTMAGALLINLLQMEILQHLDAMGVEAPLLRSQNTEGAMEANRALARSYQGRLSKPL
ncbi:sugar isomerase domain-containing protein [Pelagicoccus sp. SDUM812003]|uniref:sugar isomerase domain-containing protein n=1 Tax=Pelagicoccus sp. SDUM812003 TaxID=3041267 RepID=UPI002810817B|nr:sugar isomerase domain-containing protein [Pelagicoccus sp. SDUM812003]MDQ8204215.1 sugar isomerase domain-containing protein [Pelagicoccus sp. SDUM812003]